MMFGAKYEIYDAAACLWETINHRNWLIGLYPTMNGYEYPCIQPLREHMKGLGLSRDIIQFLQSYGQQANNYL